MKAQFLLPGMWVRFNGEPRMVKTLRTTGDITTVTFWATDTLPEEVGDYEDYIDVVLERGPWQENEEWVD